MVDDLCRCWREDLQPQLNKKGFRFHEIEALSDSNRKWLEEFFDEKVRPVLTPLAVDPSKAFPLILNKSLNIIRASNAKANVALNNACALYRCHG